ncbi:SGNH/GDSL hydrolase family protein, partial [Prochlorococcus sp. AH-736-P10]
MKILKTILINIVVFSFISLFIEIIIRINYKYDHSYYSVPKNLSKNNNEKNNLRENIHPYGSIPINSSNFYDKEWDSPKTKQRYGYFGDSVMYGVGAGYPYRISEYLDELEPNIEHVNISEVGSSFINYNDQENLRQKLILGKIDKLIYVMNLNDIAPLSNYDLKNTLSNNNSDNSKISTILRNRILRKLDESFRGKSYFYTHLRLKFKNFLMVRLNLNSTGFKAIELLPNEHKDDIKLAAKNLASLINKDIFEMPICILILPYEMQVS